MNILSKVEEDTSMYNNDNVVNKSILSPTIDDIISNLNPNRPIFPSPITLIDNTVTLSSSPIHYSTEQFDEIDDNYNDFNNHTKEQLQSNEKKHNIKIVDDVDSVSFNNMNSVIAKSSLDSDTTSIASSVRLLFLVQKYLGN